MAVRNIPQAVAFYRLFKELEDKGEHHLKIALTYSVDPTGDKNIEYLDGLKEAMQDYSLRYTNSETTFNVDTMNAYIDDVAQRTARNEGAFRNLVKEQEIDLTIVVARLLTGFDAPRLNTLYLDKLMKYQGLIQAYSRTNRVFDKNKAQGNIVCFRRPKLMKERTQDAFEKYAGNGSFKKVFRPEFKQMQDEFITAVQDLKKYVPTPADANDLQDESQSDQIEFLERFRNLAKKFQYISSYSEFNWDEQSKKYGIDEKEFGFYQGAFENVKETLNQENGSADDDEDAPELKYDFDDVVISELKIDREYVLSLATKHLKDIDNLLAEQDFTKAVDDLEKSGKTMDAKNIREFVEEEKKNGPVPQDYDASASFARRQKRIKERKILDFADEYGLDVDLLKQLVTSYEATGEFTHETSLRNSADMEIAEENGHTFKNKLQFKGEIQREWRSFITEDLAQYNKNGD